MAEESFEEKTEEPSQRKIQKAQEKGEFAKSREVSTVVTFLTVVAFMFLFGPRMLRKLETLCAGFLHFNTYIDMTPRDYQDFMTALAADTLTLLAPLFLCVIAAGLAGNWLQIGVRFSAEPLALKFDKLSPAKGIKKMFSMNSLVEGIKSIGKLFVVAVVAYLNFVRELQNMPMLLTQSVRVQVGYLFIVVLKIAFWVSLLMIIFAILDFWYQRYAWRKQLRMTKKEVQDEMKETDGNPQIKSRQRSIQMAEARKRMMQDVPKADVVITNPTHYAVALRYKHLEDRAPIVVAKGQRLIAQRIKEIAKEREIPIVENKPLAQSLFKYVKIGAEIPGEFYKAVAQVLAYVYKLKRKTLPTRKPTRTKRHMPGPQPTSSQTVM